MATHLMIFNSDAKPGREADYADWYEKVHLPQIVALPGVGTGRMFEATEDSPSRPAGAFTAVYEVDDPALVFQGIGRLRDSGEMIMTDAIDSASVKVSIFRQRF
jgi:hypothetical protein